MDIFIAPNELAAFPQFIFTHQPRNRSSGQNAHAKKQSRKAGAGFQIGPSSLLLMNWPRSDGSFSRTSRAVARAANMLVAPKETWVTVLGLCA
jgi:hypothetical protein